MELTLSLNHDEAVKLRKRAEVEGLSEQALALTAIRHFLDAKQPAESTAGPVAEVKRRYASSLKRVGE